MLLLIFNRPHETRQVFSVLREIRPRELFVFADGQRQEVSEDAESCAAARNIFENIDWPCTLTTSFLEHNAGLKAAVAQGITWFFQNVDEGIVLEDDCVPSLTFFPFCEELLQRYRNEERVMAICGTRVHPGPPFGSASYFFSHFPGIWGWASWRRAWQHFDPAMEGFPNFIKGRFLRKWLRRRSAWVFWERNLDVACRGGNTWSFAWTYNVLAQRGLGIYPNVNLVKNIGFGDSSSHSYDADGILANIPAEELLDLQHPDKVEPNRKADLVLSELHTREFFPNDIGLRRLWTIVKKPGRLVRRAIYQTRRA